MDYTSAIFAQEARDTAKLWHSQVNQTYGNDLPYHYHTDLVGAIGKKYISLVPTSPVLNRGIVLAACYLHDTIEDCRKTYNDVSKLFGQKVADLVYAVTNEKGKSRAERANDKYYEGINAVENAVFIKLCDRIANILHGTIHGGMLDMYRKENDKFLASLNTNGYEAMAHDLRMLLETGTFNFTPIE